MVFTVSITKFYIFSLMRSDDIKVRKLKIFFDEKEVPPWRCRLTFNLNEAKTSGLIALINYFLYTGNNSTSPSNRYWSTSTISKTYSRDLITTINLIINVFSPKP